MGVIAWLDVVFTAVISGCEEERVVGIGPVLAVVCAPVLVVAW